MTNLPSSGQSSSIDNFNVTRTAYREGMEDLLHYLAESLGNINAGSYSTQTVSSSAVTLASGASLQAAPAGGDLSTKIPSTSWVKENAIHIGATAPNPTVTGHIWLDTTAESGGLKYNSGTSSAPTWSPVTVAGLTNLLLSGSTTVEDLSFDGQRKFVLPAGTEAEFSTYFSTNNTTLETGMLRFNEDEGKLQVYTGSSWSSLSPNVSITTESVEREHLLGAIVSGDNLDWRLWYRSTSAVKFCNNFKTPMFRHPAQQYLDRINSDMLLDYPISHNIHDRFGWGFSGGQIPVAWCRGSWLSSTGQVYHYGSAAAQINGYQPCDHGLMATGRDRYNRGKYANNAEPAKVKRNSWDIHENYQSDLYGSFFNGRFLNYSDDLASGGSTSTVEAPDDWFDANWRVPHSTNSAWDGERVNVRGYDILPSTSIHDYLGNTVYSRKTGPYPKFVKYWVGDTTAYYLCDKGRLWFSGNVSNGNAGNGTNATPVGQQGQPYVSQVPFFEPTLPGTTPTQPLLGHDYPEIVHFCSTGMGEGSQYDPATGGTAGVIKVQTNYALDKLGYVYSWGWNNYGQLGDGSNRQDDPTAQTTNAYARRIDPSRFGNNKIKYITCSGGAFGYVFAIDENDQVWGWGNNAQGQLGLPNSTAYYDTPQNISSLNSGPAYEFSQATIEYVLPCKAWKNTHANAFFVTSDGNIYVTGTNIDYGVYTGVASYAATTNLTTPTRLRAIDGYVSPSQIGSYVTLGGSNDLDDYWEGRVVSLYCSGGIYGAMYAVVYHKDVGSSSHANYQDHAISHSTTLWSWGGNQAGILGRSTNYTAPTDYVANAFGAGTTDGNNYIAAPWTLETQYRWGVPFPVKFWDRGSPDLGGGTGFSQSGPGAPIDASKAYLSGSGRVNWYSESYANRYGTQPPNINYGTTDEFQMPQPSFGQAVNQGQAKDRYFWGVRPFGNFCAVYGNGMGTATNITVVLMNSAGNLFWAGNSGKAGTNVLASAMDPYSDGGWDTGIGTDTQVVDNGTSNGSYHQVYNYATEALDNINPYFQMFTMQPEPITDFRWMSQHDVERYSTFGNNVLNGGPKFQALGLSGTVYNTSELDAQAYTTCTADEADYFTPISKTQPIMNVGFNDRTNRNRKSYTT